jgi:hypothetical protein
MILPYVIAAAGMALHRRIQDSEHPHKEALAIGREFAKKTRGIVKSEDSP